MKIIPPRKNLIFNLQKTVQHTKNKDGTDYLWQNPTVNFKSAVEFAQVSSFYRPSSLSSKSYHVYNFFDNKNSNSDIFGHIHNSNWTNDRTLYENDPQNFHF